MGGRARLARGSVARSGGTTGQETRSSASLTGTHTPGRPAPRPPPPECCRPARPRGCTRPAAGLWPAGSGPLTLVGPWVQVRLLHVQAVTLGRSPSSSPGDSLGIRTTCLVGLGGVPWAPGLAVPESAAAARPGSNLGDGTACAEQSWLRWDPARHTCRLTYTPWACGLPYRAGPLPAPSFSLCSGTRFRMVSTCLTT